MRCSCIASRPQFSRPQPRCRALRLLIHISSRLYFNSCVVSYNEENNLVYCVNVIKMINCATKLNKIKQYSLWHYYFDHNFNNFFYFKFCRPLKFAARGTCPPCPALVPGLMFHMARCCLLYYSACCFFFKKPLLPW